MAVYSDGKRAKKRQKSKRNKIIIGILICIIILAIIYLVVSDSLLGLKDIGEIQPTENNVEQAQNNEQEANNVVEEKKDEIVSDATIPEKIGGYKVDGRLVIPKLEVTCDILHGYDEAALSKKTVGHITGPELNTPGNFCIVGHRGHQFGELYTLKKRRYIIYYQCKNQSKG